MINWHKSFWFFDIDDTLINIEAVNDLASQSIEDVFKKYFNPNISYQAKVKFIEIFNLLLTGQRIKKTTDWKRLLYKKQDYLKLITDIEKYQVKVINKYGFCKKWSRQVFIKIIADNLQIKISPEMISQIADKYWLTLTQKSQLFPGVLDLFSYIKNLNRPICLLTSSDAHLQLDSGENFYYDPQFSEMKKRQRVEMLKNKGIWFNSLSIGDPEDKPDPKFFIKGINILENNINEKVVLENSIMIGDSYTSDLETPKTKLGFGLVVLFNKHLEKLHVCDDHQIEVGNLSQIIPIIENKNF